MNKLPLSSLTLNKGKATAASTEIAIRVITPVATNDLAELPKANHPQHAMANAMSVPRR